MGKIKKLNQDKQQEQEVPRLKDGRVDFMQMIVNMFPGQIGVASYVKGICKGYALDMSMKTALNFVETLESSKEGENEIILHKLIPDEINPDKQDTVTQTDIN
tara:strand:+ start:2768 stop:3076 length:309 start_codon:yes stop_codon:yes gene_type:complete